MVNSTQLTPLYALDASAQEIIWVVGPVITTFVAIQVSTVLAILLAVAFLIGGGVWFVSSPEVGRVRIPRSKRSLGKVLARPTVLLATVVGFLLVGACAAIEAASSPRSVTTARSPASILSLFAIGSLTGGLAARPCADRPVGHGQAAVHRLRRHGDRCGLAQLLVDRRDAVRRRPRHRAGASP